MPSCCALLAFVPLAFALAFTSAIPAREQPAVAHLEKLRAIPEAMQKFVGARDISGAVTVVGRSGSYGHGGAFGTQAWATEAVRE